LKILVEIQLILGLVVCGAIIIERALPMAFEKNAALLRTLAIWERNVYFSTLIFGFIYLNFLIPLGRVPD